MQENLCMREQEAAAKRCRGGGEATHAEEVFKSIKDYEGLYKVSDFGLVKSKDGIILKNRIDKDGYLRVNLRKNGKMKTYMISHLVWDHFGDRPRNGHALQVDHIKEKWNNRIDNLQLLTNRQNVSKGFIQNGKKTSKYTGVCWGKDKNKWIVAIRENNKKIYLGSFKDEHKAHLVYQEKLGGISA